MEGRRDNLSAALWFGGQLDIVFSQPHNTNTDADTDAGAQIFSDMQARGVQVDVVICCSMISALERGGQWQLAEQVRLSSPSHDQPSWRLEHNPFSLLPPMPQAVPQKGDW